MRADIICVGNELLTGLIENSNAGFLARRIWSKGIAVREVTVVADEQEAIGRALKRALTESELIVLTGGLGPTDDDLTREAVASILDLPLVLDRGWLKRMEQFFDERGLKMPESNRKQALVIKGSRMLYNHRGTAPGAIIEIKGKMVILLPGPPNELELMFEQSVVPILVGFNRDRPVRVKTLKCIGLGESMLEEKIKSIKDPDLPPLSYVARGYEVHLQFKVTGNEGKSGLSIEETEKRLRGALGDYVFGTDDDTLAGRVAKMLTAGKLTIAFAESCSGGLLSDIITDIPGSSKFYKGGMISYSLEAKVNVLQIDRGLLEKEGEVSEATATAMADAARSLFDADFGVGITGLAGPTDNASGLPVGLVFIAVRGPHSGDCRKLNLIGGRRAIKERAAQIALDMFRRAVIKTREMTDRKI